MASVEDSTVGLTIYSDDLEPAEVSKLIGCEPTRFHRKGEITSSPRLKPPIHARIGMWSLDSDLPRTAGLEAHISNVLARVTNDLETWQVINQQYRTRIFCGIFMNYVNEGFSLSPELLKQLAERGLQLDFDIYVTFRETIDKAKGTE